MSLKVAVVLLGFLCLAQARYHSRWESERENKLSDRSLIERLFREYQKRAPPACCPNDCVNGVTCPPPPTPPPCCQNKPNDCQPEVKCPPPRTTTRPSTTITTTPPPPQSRNAKRKALLKKTVEDLKALLDTEKEE